MIHIYHQFCQGDKQMKLLKKVILGLLVVFVIIIIALFIFIKLSENAVAVNKNYYDGVMATRELEKKYTQKGSFDVGYDEYTSVEKILANIKYGIPQRLKM